jgi:SAM-dependent methyltransferase
LRGWSNENNSTGGSYHQLHLTPEFTIEGDYDMRRYVDHYAIPADLSGLRVLDVGTASGYFALECARRGGDVTAIDIWDSTPVAEITTCTDVAIAYVQKNIYDLDASFGAFDLVVCGSLLLHLPDPFGAVTALRRVCAGRLCISSSAPPGSETDERPLCEFVASKAEGGGYYSYWDVSAAALRRMLLTADFARVENEGHFVLISEPGRPPYHTLHAVMTAHA